MQQGLGCARQGRAGVYSRLSGGYDWIISQVCSMSENPPQECGLTTTPPPGQRRIRVDVQYGESPEVVEWEVTDSSKDAVAGSSAGSVTNSILTSDYVNLEPGEYQFTAKNLDLSFGEFDRIIHAES